MKESQKTARRLWPAWLSGPAARAAAEALGRAAAGFLLAGAGVAGRAMPFAACFAAAAGSPLRALAAAAGGILGYLGFWGLNGGLEYVAVSVLLFAAVCIVGDTDLGASAWFLPVMTASMAMLVGLLFLLQARFAPGAVVWYGIRLALAPAAAWAFRRVRASPAAALALYAGLLSGCDAVRLVGGVTLGQIAAVAVSTAASAGPMGLTCAAVSGLALDLSSLPPVSLTALLCFAALAAGRIRPQPVRMLVFLSAFVAGVLFTGGQMPELVPAAALGCCLSLALPARLFQDAAEAARLPAVQQRLERAAGLLTDIHDLLAQEEEGRTAPDAAQIFDRASERVCGCCVLGTQCWDQHSTETYRALCAVAPPMLERGAAVSDDFPPAFAERCCHLDGLIASINRELDKLAVRRQSQSRLRESRQILADQYDLLGVYLRRAARELEPETPKTAAFAPELGIGAAGKHGDAVSGDRSACLRTAAGMYYLLLCDGMGTGAEAADESFGTVRFLAGLLRVGLGPQEALRTLNGVYILRGDGSFSTVDLLEVSLLTGEATLYKWGSAPSYLRTADGTQKIGTAAPPPGFGVGETHKAAEYRLSLCQGEMLVLLSDGAGGEEAGRQITDWADGTPKTLAAALIARAQENGEDDMTALALRLRPCHAHG